MFKSKISKKLDLVLAIFASMNMAGIKTIFFVILTSRFLAPNIDDSTLSVKQMIYIYYPLYFQENQSNIKASINSYSEVNAMAPSYTAKLGLKVWLIDVRAQKIDGSILKPFEMILTIFYVNNRCGKSWFF